MMTKPDRTCWIVIPVYNDWESLRMLLERVRGLAVPEVSLKVLVVDDGSSLPADPAGFRDLPFLRLRLRRNLGHQRAIAVGLSYLSNRGDPRPDQVVVMDADGEDDPGAIPSLLAEAGRKTGNVIFASRIRRREGASFRTGYLLYKILFRVLTGHRISFGNFSLIPGEKLAAVVNISEIWNHYSGGLMKARIPYGTIPVPRQKRYAGKPSMNIQSLVIHGLRSIAVYLDQVTARLMIFFLGISLVILAGIMLVLYFKFFTSLAIPGWATTALTGLFILLFQALLMTFLLAFTSLNQNTQRQVIPANDYMEYVDTVVPVPDLPGHEG